MPEREKSARDPGWLLLIHQIPPKPNYFRVKIWRRLQKLGAVAIKNSVYALPGSEQAQEDLNWILREIVEGGGDASLVEARLVEGLNDEQVREMFRAARDADYEAVGEEVREVARGLPRKPEISEEKRGELSAALARLRTAAGRHRRHRLLPCARPRRRWTACSASWSRSSPRARLPGRRRRPDRSAPRAAPPG